MNDTIKCPNCDTEYLPAEIFYPSYFLGKPRDIEKDCYGKVVFNDGVEQDLTETYTCDKCGKKFIVKATVTYDVNIDKTADFDTLATTSLYKDRIVLKED